MTDLSRRDFFGRAAAGGAIAVGVAAPSGPSMAMDYLGSGSGMELQTLKIGVDGLDEIEASVRRLERIGLPLLRAGAEAYPDPNLDADIECLRSVSRVVKYRMQNERDRQRDL